MSKFRIYNTILTQPLNKINDFPSEITTSIFSRSETNYTLNLNHFTQKVLVINGTTPETLIMPSQVNMMGIFGDVELYDTRYLIIVNNSITNCNIDFADKPNDVSITIPANNIVEVYFTAVNITNGSEKIKVNERIIGSISSYSLGVQLEWPISNTKPLDPRYILGFDSSPTNISSNYINTNPAGQIIFPSKADILNITSITNPYANSSFTVTKVLSNRSGNQQQLTFTDYTIMTGSVPTAMPNNQTYRMTFTVYIGTITINPFNDSTITVLLERVA